jgi:hypothetical protein
MTKNDATSRLTKILILTIKYKKMERRVALKSVAVAMGAMAGLPAWASGWSKGSLPKGRLLSADQSKNLAAIVEAIIPKTDTPGAGELGVGILFKKW